MSLEPDQRTDHALYSALVAVGSALGARRYVGQHPTDAAHEFAKAAVRVLDSVISASNHQNHQNSEDYKWAQNEKQGRMTAEIERDRLRAVLERIADDDCGSWDEAMRYAREALR